MKQDMNGVRTAQDLEQKYNLGVIDEIKKETQKNTEQITSTNNELKDFTTQVTKDLGELHDQVDGNIMTWFQSGVPTLDNYPANEWVTDEEKNNHLGDLYYDKDTGYAYRFTLENGIYNWLKLTDSDIAEALAVANAAQDTADSKRRVFLEQPTPPYDNGDMWIKDKEIWICQISKAEGESFAEKDFINDLKYTDDTVANQVGENLKILSGTVLEIRNDVDEYSRTLTETQKIVNEQGEEIGTLNTKYSSVEQSVNSLEQQVSEIQTFINYVEGNGSVTLENTSNTNLYKLSIKGDISLLFGNDGKQYGQPQFFREDLYFSEDLLFTEGVPLAEPLYPSPNLFGKNMNLIIEYKEDDKEVYKLPFSYLNYLSQEVADEFILEDGKAKIIRRVGINSSMQKYELPNEVLEELGDFTIPLKEGNPKIYLQCFDSAIYNATYMIKNAYTEEFATKVELNSSITQLSNDITLEVNGKIDTLDEDINAKLELKVDTKNLVSEINASADVIRLNSNRFSMTSDYSSITEDGEATFKKADIGGFITDENSFSKDLNGIYDYSEFDLQFLRYVLLEYVNINNDTSTKNILDVINDGELDSADLLAIREIIQGLRTNNKVVQGSFYINSNNPKNCFVIKDNSGDVVVSLGLGGVNSNQVVTQNIVCANTKTTDTSLNKYVTINGIDGNIKASGKVEATTITQTSIAEKKKNFELYQDALSEIAKIDIYKYNLVDEQDGDKKHIGFVIGNEFNYSEEITNQENNQVDLYSMISMCMQGLKEQQEIIKKLEKRIEVLENENIGKN